MAWYQKYIITVNMKMTTTFISKSRSIRVKLLRHTTKGQPSMYMYNQFSVVEKEREKMPYIVATYVYTGSQGQRTYSAQTNFLA